VYPMYLQL
jgi:hypothetical protein